MIKDLQMANKPFNLFNFTDNLKATKFNTYNTISHIKLERCWNENILYCCGTDEAVSSYIGEVLSDKNPFGKQIESIYWPKISFRVSCNIIWKTLNKLLGQPNVKSLTLKKKPKKPLTQYSSGDLF